MIVAPVTLTAQLMAELHRYFKHGTFDVFPYTGSRQTRGDWWKEILGKSKHKPGRNIIVATPSVSIVSWISTICVSLFSVSKSIESDFEYTLSGDAATPTESPAPVGDFATKSQSTIYGQRFLVGAYDEAHRVRKVKKAYWSAFALRERTSTMVAMTATPAVSSVSVRSNSVSLNLLAVP